MNNIMNIAFIDSVQPRTLAYAAGGTAGARRRRAPARADRHAALSCDGQQLRGSGNDPDRRQTGARVQMGSGRGAAAAAPLEFAVRIVVHGTFPELSTVA